MIVRLSLDADPTRPASISRARTSDRPAPIRSPSRRQPPGLRHRQAQDLRRRRAQRDPDADFVRPLRHEMRHDAVGADDREHQREAAEHRHHSRDESQAYSPIPQRLAHRHHVEHRLCGVDGADGGTRLRRQQRRIASGPNQQLEVARRALRVGHIHDRAAALQEPVLDDVTGDANHGQPGTGTHAQPLSDRVEAGPVPAGERLADDGDRLGIVRDRRA